MIPGRLRLNLRHGRQSAPPFRPADQLATQFEVIRNPEFGTDIKPKAAEGFAQWLWTGDISS
jgi:hypothetical protein